MKQNGVRGAGSWIGFAWALAVLFALLAYLYSVSALVIGAVLIIGLTLYGRGPTGKFYVGPLVLLLFLWALVMTLHIALPALTR